MIKKVRQHINQNELLIFENSSPGKRGYQLPALNVPAVDAEAVLGFRVTVFRRFAEPADSLGVVLRHSSAVVITEAESVLSIRLALLCTYADYLRGLSEFPLNRFLFVYPPKDCCPTYRGDACSNCRNFPK